MPSGEAPTYGFIPAQGGEPSLRTCSSSRARLWAGGTYFRVREPGGPGNRISVQVIEYEGPLSANPDAVCVVTNYTVDTAEMVTGPVKALITSNQLAPTNYVVIDQLDTTTPRARQYGISFKIAPDAPTETDLGPFSFSRAFVMPGSLVAKLTPDTALITPSSEIVITPRHRVYRLAVISVTDPETLLVTTGWDIADLRAQVNASDPWIEMLERSGPIDDGMGGTIPNPNPVDVQDEGTDDVVLTPFAESFLSGGDGLPTGPDKERTGPTRSIVHVNYGERHDGSMAEVNVVYEWRGDSSTEGAWVSY